MSAILFGAGRAPMKHISSRKNPLVAACRALARGGGIGPSRMLLDGVHLVTEAIASGIAVETAVLSERFLASDDGLALERTLAGRGIDTLTATDPVMEAISPVSTPSGVVAIAARPQTILSLVLAGPPQLVVVGMDVQDPGNVGAIVRAAEAAGATGVAFCGACADPFGWKALRGAMGSMFRLPTASGLALGEFVVAARGAGIRVVAAVPRDAPSHYDLDLGQPTAFLLGGEGPGLPAEAVASADGRVSIPMRPPVESLNVAVAAALLVYEAARQRRDALSPSSDRSPR